MPEEDLKARVAAMIRTEVAPAFAIDGDGVEVVDVANGIAQIRFTGACAGCPASIMTLIMGLEQELRTRFPEIEFLEAVP
jgi:Fe-S cluster biogenesis protein NfuA